MAIQRYGSGRHGMSVQPDGEWVKHAQHRSEVDGLGNLLAIIHRDGGHYQQQHGTKKAVDDAHAEWGRLITLAESVPTLTLHLSQLAEERDGLREALTLVATGIWRNREMNTCGLSGAAMVVHAVEAALAAEKEKAT